MKIAITIRVIMKIEIEMTMIAKLTVQIEIRIEQKWK